MKDWVKTIAVLICCMGAVFIRPLTLILAGMMGLYVVCVIVWSIWKAWGPGHKNENLDLPDQDVFHEP
jgi:hypothetical protein